MTEETIFDEGLSTWKGSRPTESKPRLFDQVRNVIRRNITEAISKMDFGSRCRPT